MRRLWICLLLALALCGCAGKEEALVFSYDGIQIAVNEAAGPVLYALGEPLSCTQTPSCAYEGMETTYSHGSFSLTTYCMGGSEYIQRLWFQDDTVTTAEGLRLGDSRQAAEQLYGQAQEDRILTQWKGGRLLIMLEEEKVSGIMYEALGK